MLQSLIFIAFTDGGESLTLSNSMVVFLQNPVEMSYYGGI